MYYDFENSECSLKCVRNIHMYSDIYIYIYIIIEDFIKNIFFEVLFFVNLNLEIKNYFQIFNYLDS